MAALFGMVGFCLWALVVLAAAVSDKPGVRMFGALLIISPLVITLGKLLVLWFMWVVS